MNISHYHISKLLTVKGKKGLGSCLHETLAPRRHVHWRSELIGAVVAGVSFLAIHRQFVRPAVGALAEARGTAGAPRWLINAAARTSSPPPPPNEDKDPLNTQPVRYACLSLSVDRGRTLSPPRPSWSSAGGVEVPRGRSGTQTNYHFMTKRSLCCQYIID